MDQSNAMPSMPNVTKSPVSGLKIALIAIVIIALGTGGVFAYEKMRLTPEQVMAKSGEALKGVKSLGYHGDIAATMHTVRTLPSYSVYGISTSTGRSIGNTSTFSMSFDGASDVHDTSSPRSAISTTVTVQPDPSLSMAFAFDARMMNKVTYVNVKTVPTLGLFDLTFLRGKWIKIDPAQIQDQIASSGLLPEARTISSTAPTADQVIRIRQAFFDKKPVKIIGKLPSDTIDGQKTYHYAYTVDKNATIEYVATVSAIMRGHEVSADERTMIQKTLNSITSVGGEIWIGTSDFYPRKITMNIDVNQTDPTIMNGQVAVTLLFRAFNAPVVIDAPADSVTVQELMTQVLGGALTGSEPDPMFGTSTISTGVTEQPQSTVLSRDAKRMSNLREMQTALELYYMDHNAYPVAHGILGEKNMACLSDPRPPKIGGFSSANCATPVMGVVPKDPVATQFYVYSSDTKGSTYMISAKLEGTTDGLSGHIVASPTGIVQAK